MAKFGFDATDAATKLKDILRPNVIPKVPGAPKPPLGTRIGTAIAPHVQGLGKKLAKGAGRLALPAALLQSASSEVAPESKIFPKFGEIARINEERAQQAYEEGGILPALGEVGSNILPAVGMAAVDIFDYGKSFFGGDEARPAISPITPSTTRPLTPTPAETETGVSLPATAANLPVPVPTPTERANKSFFINLQGGERPGEKQFFEDVRLSSPAEQPEQLPARLPTRGQPGESPLVAAAQNLNLPQFDASRDSFGDLLGKRLQLINEGGKLIPALAQTKERAEQQRRGEVERGFGLEALGLEQDKEFRTSDLELAERELGERGRQSDIANIVRLRGQDIDASTRRAVAGAKAAKDPLDFEEQLKQQESLTELSLRDYPTAPAGFAEAVPGLIQQGASRAQVQDAFNQVSADQVLAFKTPVNELDPQKFYDAVAKVLGLVQ